MADDSSPVQTGQLLTLEQAQQLALARRPDRTPVESYVPVFDTFKFEHYGRVATVMQETGMLPESLIKDGKEFVPERTQKARAFMIVELADRWSASPFALMQACSYVHGKLMLEGKVVHGTIESNVGVVLKYEFGRWNALKEVTDLSEEGEGDLLGVRVSAMLPGETEPRFIDGGVGSWKTSGNNSPWKAGAYKRQLRYRGAREWCRAFKPSLLIGILTDDELDGMVERQVVSSRGRSEKQDIRGKLAGPKAGGEGFSQENVEDQTGARVIDAQATVVDAADLKVGGEPAEREAADEAQAGSAGAQLADAGGGSPAAAEETPRQEAPKETARKPRAKPKAASDDPIGDFIDSLSGLEKWAEEIKPTWFAFKKSDAFKDAPQERKTECAVAIVERVFELGESGFALDPHEDPTLFSSWCTYMVEKGVRPTCAQDIGRELGLLQQTDAFKAISEAGRNSLESYAAWAIGETGKGLV